MADFGRTKENIDRIMTDGGKIRFSAMDDQVKRSTEALLNSMTELEYPTEGGIIGRSKTDHNDYTIFNSGGFGIFKDGVLTEAITVDGFNLSAGVIGRLTAQNIDTTNLAVENLLTRNHNGYLVASIQKKEMGGRVRIYDSVGKLNAVLGSESGSSDNIGGTLVLYEDGESLASRRVEAGISKTYSAGLINLRDSVGVARVALYANSNLGPILAVLNSAGVAVTRFTESSAYVGGKELATKEYVDNAIAKHISDYHTV